MSEKLPNQQPSEEIDLGQLFNAIGKLFNKLFAFIKAVFTTIFSVIIYSIKPIIKHWKIIVGVVVLSFIGGKILEKSKITIYSSQMLVRPYFDSQYQLVDNIEYYNSLISTKDYETLSNIFNVNEDNAKEIISFKISPGPETENERIVQYDRFVKSIDSIRAQDIDFDDYIENRSIYSGNLFQIKVHSYKKDIFPNLEDGLNSSFTNKYSIKKMEKRDSMISIQKANILKDIDEVQKLQSIYINVLEEESKSKENKISLGENLSLTTESKKTREFELLNREIQLRNELSKLDEEKIQEDVFFDTISSFQKIGSPVREFRDKHSLIFPVISFILLCLIYILVKFIRFVKEYE